MSNRPTPEAIERKEVEESLHCDFKREVDLSSADKRNEFVNDVVAFLNAEGGYLIIGVDEGKKQRAVTFRPLEGSKDDVVLQFQNTILDSVSPRPLDIMVEGVDVEGGFLLYVVIGQRNSEKPYCNRVTGTYKQRVGNRNVALLPGEIAALAKPRALLLDEVRLQAKAEYGGLRENQTLTLDCPELHLAILPLEHFNHDFPVFNSHRSAFSPKVFHGFHGYADAFKRVSGGFDVRQTDMNGNVISRFFVSDTWFIHSVVCYPISMQEGRGNIAFGTMEKEVRHHLENVVTFVDDEGLVGPFAVDMRIVNLWAAKDFDRMFPRTREIAHARPLFIPALNAGELASKLVGQTRQSTVFG